MNDSTSPDSSPVIAIVVVVGVLGAMLIGLLSSQTRHEVTPVVAARPAESVAGVEPTSTWPSVVPTPYLATVRYYADDVTVGKSLFSTNCSSCHGSSAEGIPGLGKNLVHTEYMESVDDAQLREFIIVGRPPWDPSNSTGVIMPARGGNPSLSNAALDQIVAYLRTIGKPQLISYDRPAGGGEPVVVAPARTPLPFATISLSGLSALQPTALPTLDAPIGETAATEEAITIEPTATIAIEATPEASPEPTVEATPEVSAPVVAGFDAAAAYTRACASCHGADGRGQALVPNSDLTGKSVLGNDSLIFVYLTTAQPFGAYPHPFRGGYPELNDAEIFAVIDYLQTLPVANP